MLAQTAHNCEEVHTGAQNTQAYKGAHTSALTNVHISAHKWSQIHTNKHKQSQEHSSEPRMHTIAHTCAHTSEYIRVYTIAHIEAHTHKYTKK